MRENLTYGSMRGCWRRDYGTDCGTGAVAEAAGNRCSEFLSLPRQRSTLQMRNTLEEECGPRRDVESLDPIVDAIFSRFNEEWETHGLDLVTQAA